MDLSASQAQPSAARAGPRRPTRRVEADHRRRVVRHNGHPRGAKRAAMPWVGDARRSTAQQAGHETFPPGRLYPPAEARCTWHGVRARGTSPWLRSRRTCSGAGDGGRGSPVLGIPTVRLPCWCKASRREVSLKAKWVAERSGGRRDPSARLLPRVDPGRRRPGSPGMPHGQRQGTDDASAGSALRPGWRPHGAGQGRCPDHSGPGEGQRR